MFLKLLTAKFSETNSKSFLKKSLLSAISHSKTKNSRTQKHKMQNTKHPCGICQKSVRKNQTACFCSLCKHWVHFTKCNQSSLAEYHLLVEEDESVPWYCLQCTINPIPHGVFWITHTWGGQIQPAHCNTAILKDMDLKFGMLQ